MPSSPSDKNLVWVDLEMTGLDPDRHAIIEIATLVTDGELNILAEGPVLAIHQPDEVLTGMDAWCVEHHGKSGLTARVQASSVSLSEAEEQTLGFVRQFVPEKTSPLCGNSVGHDRRFLIRHMPRLHDFLHYRNVDVSTVKELVKRWYPQGPHLPEKKSAHLALEDIRESIDELRFYRKHFFLPG